MLLFLEPMCLNLCLLSAIALGIQYLFFGSFKIIFGTVYNWGLWQSGLAFAGITAGMVAAVVADPWYESLPYSQVSGLMPLVVGVAGCIFG